MSARARAASDAAERVRLDRWLWAARFFKSRTLATQAIAGGKARLNGHRAKPGAPVQPGDTVQVRKGPYELELVVRALADKRGPARAAAALYEETEAGRAARELVAAALQSQPVVEFTGKGRPTKRDRRRIERLVEEWPD
jgi:ribosome-associated heat shock protein Hsp15